MRPSEGAIDRVDKCHEIERYGKDNIASSIIIDEKFVSSVTPGHDMDDDMMNFCLSW